MGSRPSAGASAASEYRCWGRPTWPRASVSTCEQPDLAHALEVRTHRVHVQIEDVGDLGRREGQGRARQLEVDRVPGVVPERLEDVESR